MDPLFGFNGFGDEITEHQAQLGGQSSSSRMGEVGEYTISFPVDSQNYSTQLQQGNPQFGNPPTSQPQAQQTTNQVVHVVSGADEKQVYVIKLENILQDGGGGENVEENKTEEPKNIDSGGQSGGNEPQKMEEGSVSSHSNSESSSSSEDDAKEKEGENKSEEEDDGPDPYNVVSPEAVMAMAQSVGVDLHEDFASELGCIVTNKLRHLLLVRLAIDFAQHENSEGITVEHFSKAEEQIMGSLGAGHESVFKDTAYKYAGGVSILDDGPEIDLLATLRQKDASDITIDVVEPVLNVHHLLQPSANKNSQAYLKNVFKVYEEPVGECYRGDEDDEEDQPGEGEATVTEETKTDDLKVDTEGKTETKFELEDSEGSETSDIVDDLLKEFDKQDQSDSSKKDEDEVPGPSENENECATMAPEWTSYLELLFEQIATYSYDEDFECGDKTDFGRILKDIRQNGLHPVFSIVCECIRDFLGHPEIKRASIINILSLLDAMASSRCELSLEQLNDVGSVLIEVISLPPPCEVHPFLNHVFMKVLKNCNELLTWTCTYVTEMLKGISELPLDQLSEALKSTMHGALCLANGLEDLKIQVAQEFGWHASLLVFSQKHSAVFDGQAYSPSVQDSFLEEEILKFYHNFLNNYTNRVKAHDLSSMREMITSIYGEKFQSYVPPTAQLSYKKTGSTSVSSKNTKKIRCVFRKIVYNNREIVVPYRRKIK